MTRKLSRTLWIALVLPAILVTTILLSTPQTARSCGPSRCGKEFYYYNDASHTTLVGWQYWDCNCNLYSWGTTTFYRKILEADCCG